MTHKLLKGFAVFQRIMLRLLILTAVGFLFQCTAYFNTFYNGKSAFREANKAHNKILRNFPDSIIIKPTAEIQKKYERSIEKSNKTIESYPQKQRWHDDALLLMGKAYYYKRDNARAIKRCLQVQKEFPESPLIPQTYLYLGKAYLDMEEYDKAEQMFGVILEKYPFLDKNNQVSFLLVEIAIRRGGRSQAISLLEKAYETLRSKDKKIQILLRIAELYVDLKQYEKAITLLVNAPRKNDLPQQSFRMDKALFTCYAELGDYEKALNHVNKMIRRKLYEKYRLDLLMMKASIFQRLDRVEDAVAVYLKITDGVDSSSIGSDTSTVIGKAFYELALIYQKQYENYDQSLHYATLASKSRDTTSKFKSLHLVSAFNMLKQLRSEIDSTDTDKQNRLFRIGELFRFELSEPDSAYWQFTELAANSEDSQTIIPMALCAAAFVARDEMKDSIRADSLFNLLIVKYPVSDYAKVSQKELNVQVTIKTRRDSAYEAFRQAELLVYGKERDVKSAINGFYDVYRNFGEIDIAPKSLYVAAWLIDDVLQKNKTAKDLYERLCERYPESYYCTAEATPRLNEVAEALKSLDPNSSMQKVNSDPVPDSTDNEFSEEPAEQIDDDLSDESEDIDDDFME